MRKRRFGLAISATAVVLFTAACGQRGAPIPTASTGSEGASLASTAAKPGIMITSPRLVLPAVGGRPGAVYFTIANTGERRETIVGVAVRGAQRSQMHETNGGSMAMIKTLDVPAQGTAKFAPGGRHVMVFGLPSDLRAGGRSELTLNFAGGKSVSAPLMVLAPGSGGQDDMAGMTMDH